MFIRVLSVVVSTLLLSCAGHGFFDPELRGQGRDSSIVSRHVRIQIPSERQWLGRESISDLERCWEFVQGATGGRLPGRVLVVVEWDDAVSAVDAVRGTISIGMADPAAAKDLKGFLLHHAARELSRLAFTALSGNGAAKSENRFLLDGMSELLAHDFTNTVRRLGASWALCYYLDRIAPLGLKQLADRPRPPDIGLDLRSAAPGITFLTTCRERYGRERVLRLFELLARRNLNESLAAAFRTTAPALEAEWLKRIRNYTPADITIAGEEETPVLERITFAPEPARAGAAVSVKLFTRDGANDLKSAGIFVLDESSARVLQGREFRDAEGRYTQFEIPIDASRQAGRYRLSLIAVDEGGNIRNWEAHYSVMR